MSSMISATKWVPRGLAAEFPVKYDLDDAEMERISSMAKLQLEDAKADLAEAEGESESESRAPSNLKSEEEQDADLKEYDLENYDEDEPEESKGIFNGVQSLAYYEPGEKDPYITLPSAEDEQEELEEVQILASDNLILATKTEEEVSYLEVYVYNDASRDTGRDDEELSDEPTLYVHHDIMLPSFPLCVERFDYRVGNAKVAGDPAAPGNFAAIGTFEPEIEIWNLDVVDSVYPDLVLGQRPEDADLSAAPSKKYKKKAMKLNKKRLNDSYHVDAVLSLSANRLHRNLLASGSADTTIKLWDLNTGLCAKSFTHHGDKVSAVEWNPSEGTVLLSGGYDGRAIVSDLRASGSEGLRTWNINDGDIEGAQWGSNGHDFYVSTEHGRIHKFDARQDNGKSLWTLQAHDAGITSFDVNNFVEGYLVTASSDKVVKLWNVSEKGPSLILSRDLDVGSRVFSVGFGPDKEVWGHVVAAGSGGIIKVWDTMTNRTVRDGIGKRAANLGVSRKKNVSEKVVSVVEANDDEDDEGEDGFEDMDDEDNV